MNLTYAVSAKLPLGLAMGLALLVPCSANALTLGELKGSQLEAIYGTYAPHGDCKLEPRITVDDSGFAYMLAGKATHSHRIEYAISYGGEEYSGTSRWLFPFPVGDDDFGRVLMTFNPDEKPGALLVEADLGPGQSLTPLQGALVKASHYARCARGK